MSREDIEEAIEVLEDASADMLMETGDENYYGEAIAVLRQALETEQEPVAWISDSPTKGNGKQLHWTKAEAFRWSSNITPLYTATPKCEWVGLTDEERHNIREWQEIQKELGPVWAPMMLYLYLAIEQALKEKNHG
jgi:hypothetical protein